MKRFLAIVIAFAFAPFAGSAVYANPPVDNASLALENTIPPAVARNVAVTNIDMENNTLASAEVAVPSGVQYTYAIYRPTDGAIGRNRTLLAISAPVTVAIDMDFDAIVSLAYNTAANYRALMAHLIANQQQGMVPYDEAYVTHVFVAGHLTSFEDGVGADNLEPS